MSSNDILIVAAGAAIGAALLIVGLVRRSRSFDEGMRKIRLLVNVVLLGFYYAVVAGAIALFALGLLRDDTNYWWAAIFLLLIGFMLFRDLSARNRNPMREWFSRHPFRTRVQGLEEETSELLDELAAAKPEEGSAREDAGADAEGSTDGAHWSRTERKEGDQRVRVYKFEFRWPPRKRGS